MHSNGGITFSDTYHMPIYLRHFYLRRLQTHYEDEVKELRKEFNKSKTRYGIKK